jgi:hypothetical protein
MARCSISQAQGQVTYHGGRAIAQAVSRWLPTAAARVRARVWSCGICGGQSGAGAVVLRFPLPIFIPPIAPQSPSSIIWRLYNRPEVAAVPRDLVPPHKIKKKTSYSFNTTTATSFQNVCHGFSPWSNNLAKSILWLDYFHIRRWEHSTMQLWMSAKKLICIANRTFLINCGLPNLKK